MVDDFIYVLFWTLDVTNIIIIKLSYLPAIS